MADQYPVQAYLHRIKQTTSAECPFCPETRETLAHFACVCPRFREGRTAAHNQVRKLISSLLVKYLHHRWELHEETPMANTGLRLNRVSVSCMEVSGRPLPDQWTGPLNCLQPRTTERCAPMPRSWKRCRRILTTGGKWRSSHGWSESVVLSTEMHSSVAWNSLTYHGSPGGVSLKTRPQSL